MWENKEKFPSKFICPPENSFSYSDVLYKVSTTNKENDSYLRKTFIDNNKPFNNPEKMCQACGHSVFLSKEDVMKSKKLKGKVSKGVLRKWNYINSFKPSHNSKILPTPSKTSHNHHTYWHYGEYNILFCCLGKI